MKTIEIRNNTRSVWEIEYKLEDGTVGQFLIGGNDDGASVRRLGKQTEDGRERLGNKVRVTREVFTALLRVNGVRALFEAEDFEAPGYYTGSAAA